MYHWLEETPFDFFIIGWRRLHLIYHWMEEAPFNQPLVAECPTVFLLLITDTIPP